MIRIVYCLLLILISAQSVAANPAFVRRQNAVPGEYIVVLKNTPAESVQGVANSVAASYDLDVLQVWSHALQGFLAAGSIVNAEALAEDPRIEFVEQNALFTQVDNTRLSGTETTSLNGQWLWHLDRLDQQSFHNPAQPAVSLKDDTYHMCTEARSVYAYVLDTGVRYRHKEFGGRVVTRLDFSSDKTGSGAWSTDTTEGCLNEPSGYHGTAVAALLTGENVGAARTKIVSLKVLDCATGGGQTSWVISALDWIANPLYNPYIGYRGLINLSGFRFEWDTGFSSLNTASRNLVAATQFPFFTSADNYSVDACRFAPNAEAYTLSKQSGRIMVVGASTLSGTQTDHKDYKWQKWKVDGTAQIGPETGSNAGPCVGVIAPGAEVYTAHQSGNDSDPSNDTYARYSGTSFASPLAAAVAARWIETRPGKPFWYEVYNFLINNSSATVNNSGTREAWACVSSSGSVSWHEYDIPCNNGTKYYFAPYATTSARMVYYSEGVCP